MVHFPLRVLAGCLVVAVVFPAAGAEVRPPIPLGPGLSVRNVEDPFDYFRNSWTVIGLKDHVYGTRITPSGELVLANGLLCRPLVGKTLAPLNWRVKKTLRKGYLPIVQWDFILNEEVRTTIEAFACPLDRDWKAGYNWPKGSNFLNLVRVTSTNLKKTPAEAAFGLEWRPKKGKLDCVAKPATRKSRFTVLAGGAQIALLDLPDGAKLDAKGSRLKITASLAGGARTSVVAYIPFLPVRGPEAETLRTLAEADFETWAARTASFWEGLLARGTQIDVPEEKPLDTYRASMVYQFISRDKGDVHPGEGFYDGLFLRDGAYQALSLAHAGYLHEAKQSFEHFLRFQGKDGFFCTQRGQLDGHGYAMWALVEHWRLSRDATWLQRVYPQVVKAVKWVQQARRREKDPASPFFGVLPAAPADGENLWNGKHHILGYDWWSLRGLQSAAAAARALGKDKDAAAFAKEFEDFRKCIFQALDKTGLPYIPPSYEKVGTHWGNLEVIFPSLLIDPQDKRLTATLDFVRTKFGEVEGEGGGFIEGIIQWSPPQRGAIHPYMSQFVTNSHIVRGEQAEAVDGFYSFLLHTTSTNAFPEGVYYRRRQAWGNTLPHQWAAALYAITFRNMLVREQGDTLHLLSAVPRHWLDAGKRIRVAGAPTHFGQAGFTASAEKDAIRVQVVPPDRNPPRKLIIHLPEGIEATEASIDGTKLQIADRRAVLLPADRARKPCTVTIGIRRVAKGEPMTFASKVAAYQAESVHAFKPIPGLAPPPGKVDERDCVKLGLARFANTNPLTAPFNVPNPGTYLFTGLPLGDQTVAGIPYHVLDPAKNAGKGLLVINGAQACARFPKQVTVPVGAQGRFLCVLGNVTGWASGDPGVGRRGAVAEYEVRYADGTVQKIPLITGRTADDWAMAPSATDLTVGLKAGIWHLNVLTIALKPKPVASVVIRDLGTPASPVIAAITLVK